MEISQNSHTASNSLGSSTGNSSSSSRNFIFHKSLQDVEIVIGICVFVGE